MITAGMIGVGKMGLSHYAILGGHPLVDIRAICDSAGYITSTLRKYTGVKVFKNYRKLLDESGVDFVVVATPTSTHYEVAAYALERGIHVFVEKPLCLNPTDSWRLAELAEGRLCVNQVGFHNRFLATFREAARLVKDGVLGRVHHISGSAFGQVVIRPKTGATWRAKTSEGGGCLRDYASHVVDLMNYVVGVPKRITGAQLKRIYSDSVEDAVYALLEYPDGATGTLETNWSDETYRKMSTSLVVYGDCGKIVVDRQELRVFLKDGTGSDDYADGWTIRYITDLQEPVQFYLRGEEYSAQLDAFVEAVRQRNTAPTNCFRSAYETDWVIDQIARTASGA